MRKLALALSFLALLAAADPAAALSLGGVRNQLVQWLLAKVSVEDVFEISVDEVVDAEGGRGTTLVGVRIADAEGTWFTADRLTFDWNRSQLLRGQLVIETLRLENAEIMRQPVIPPGEAIEVDLENVDKPPEPFIWPRSPISTEIRSLVLQNIHLHQPVLGQSIRFDASGAFRDIGDTQAASLNLKRTDEVQGSIELAYTNNFEATTLQATLDASEAAGGLVAAMLELPGQVPASLSLKADGTPQDFNIGFQLAMPDYLQADGTAVLDYAGPLSVDADFAARPGPLMPQDIARVLGDEARLVVRAAEDDDRTFQIETARLSSPFLRADASGTYSRATGAADLQVSLVAEPELAAPFEGVEFAGLNFEGNIQGQPGALSARGDLSLEGFSAASAAVERATLAIEAGQSGSAQTPTTDLTVRGDVEGLRLDRIPAEVIGSAGLDIDASMTGSVVTLRTAGIDSKALQLSASGAADTASGEFDIAFRAAAPQIGPVLQPYGVVAEGAIAASGHAVSRRGTLRVESTADLTGLRHELADADRLHLAGTVTQEGERTAFELTGAGDRLRIDQLGPDLLDRAEVAASGSLVGDLVTLREARLTSAVLDARAEGQGGVDGKSGKLDYRISSPQIGPVATAYGVAATGGVEATGTVALAPEGPTLTTDANLTDFTSEFADAGRLHLAGTVAQQGERLSFDLTGAGERMRIDRMGPDVLGTADFAARGALDGQELTLAEARLESPLLEATAGGAVNLETMAGRIEYDVAAVTLGPVAGVYDVPVAGTASAMGAVDLAAPATPGGAPVPRITGSAAVQGLVYDGTAIGDATLAHEVTLSEAPNGTLDLQLTGGQFAPASARTRFALEGQRLALDALNLSALGIAARGDLAVNIETMLAEGTLDIDAADLARLPGAGVSGSADGRLRLTAPAGRQNASLNLTARGLGAGGVAIGAARIEGQVQDALGTPRLDLRLTADQIVSGQLALASLTATARGPLSAVEIALDGTGELDRKPLTLAAAARADLAGPAMRATVRQLELAIGTDEIALLQPLTIVSQDGAVRIGDLAMALPDNGRLTGELGYFGGPIAGDIVLDMPDISVLARLFDAPVQSGAFKVTADFDTRSGRAKADIAATGREIVFADISGAGVLGLDATLAWNGRVADLDASVTGSFGEPLVVKASLPVRSAGGIPTLAERGPVEAHINWNGEIGDLWALVPAPGNVVTGEATIDIGVSGDIANPRFTGGVLVADGTYQNLDAGTILTGLSLATEIREGGALGITLDATDGANGRVHAAGRVDLGEQGVDLTIETPGAVLVRRDDAAVRLAVDLRVSGPIRQLAIVGTVQILEAEIRLVNANPPNIITLGDVRIKGEPPPDQDDDDAALPIRLQIDVTSPGGRIFVRGRGLDSQWQAGLQVRGDASQPIVTGEISAVRGQLNLVGKTFELARGRVIFDGGREIDPRLDVVLERQTTDITGRIIVSGFASNPRLSFNSTPALPQDEVLPRVLFGTSSQGLTASQGIQLAIGLATLLDGGGGTFDQLRNAVGLDTLDIEQNEEGDASLAVGEQIDENIWIGTKQSLSGNGGTSVAVEIDVFENIQVEGEAGTNNTSVGVQWRRDF